MSGYRAIQHSTITFVGPFLSIVCLEVYSRGSRYAVFYGDLATGQDDMSTP